MGMRYLNHDNTAFIRKENQGRVDDWKYLDGVFVMKGVTFQTAVTCLVQNMAQAGILVWVTDAAKPVLILA